MELNAIWRNGATVFLGAGEGQRSVGGTGFVVSSKWSSNIISCEFRSPRIGILLLRLDNTKTLKIVQVYAPTMASDDDEVEEFYEQLDSALITRATYTVVMGDFNAKLGRGGRPGERYIGKFGIGERNERGSRMVSMVETSKLFVGNTWFKKKAKRRWTWIAPNARTKNEIDYFLVDTRRILRDVSVVPSFNTGSDHRMLRARIHIIPAVERRVLQVTSQRGRPKEIDEEEMQRQVELTDWTMGEELDEDYHHLTEKILQCAKKAQCQRPRQLDSRISEATRELLAKRRDMKRDKTTNVEYSLLCKLIRRKLKEDLEDYNRRRKLAAVERKQSLKKCRRELLLYHPTMTALKWSSDSRTTDRAGMEEICREFYTNLFASHVDVPSPPLRASCQQAPCVLVSEVRNAALRMKDGKAPGSDGINIELIKAGGHEIWRALAIRFSRYLAEKKVPSRWKESKTVLLYKKGDKEDLKNYRPICLLSHIYKLFTRVITNRLTRYLDEQQPREQAGFRQKYSTTDHIFALNQLLERAREYQLPLCLLFVDYEKAFDSVELNAVLQALAEEGIDEHYIQLIKELNTGCSTDITLFTSPVRIPIEKGVRQGDPLSPKLFTACLEMVFRKMNWRDGVNIDGEKLNHLRFADDVVLIAKNSRDLNEMLQELNAKGKEVGLKINAEKSKIMQTAGLPKANILIDGVVLEEVDSYVYLGQEVNMRHDLQQEISRRKAAGWRKFYSIIDVLKGATRNNRTHLFNATVLKAMTYGSETWSLTKGEEHKLAVTERAMERRMLGVSLRDHIENKTLRQMSGVADVVGITRESKIRWAGHVARLADNRWTSRIAEWYPRDRKRPLGRPPRRWCAYVVEVAGRNWRQVAQDRRAWDGCARRAFASQ